MEELLIYLKKQKKEREYKINEFSALVEEFQAAQKRADDLREKVNAFGDVADIEAEIEKLDEFIAQVSAKTEETVGGAVDEVVVTCTNE